MKQAWKLTAPLKDYIWGGQTLKNSYNKVSDLSKVSESWELSCHKDGVSVILNGDYAGKLLTELIADHPEVCGTAAENFDSFPILIKLIDAADNLSVQVHPDNEYALRVEGEYGKTEVWYVLEAEEGATLIYGFAKDMTREEFAKHIEDQTLQTVLNHVPVKAGDVFFIQSGTLHGIGKGIVIAEIQQNSNTTYRVDDYGRVGADGKPRDLHVEKALEVTTLTRPENTGKPLGEPVQKDGYCQTLLSSCVYFTVNRYEIDQKAPLCCDDRSFHAITVVDGEMTLSYGDESFSLIKGESAFVAASTGDYQLIGKGTALVSTIGE